MRETPPVSPGSFGPTGQYISHRVRVGGSLCGGGGGGKRNHRRSRFGDVNVVARTNRETPRIVQTVGNDRDADVVEGAAGKSAASADR